jgi:aminomethyltransferase
MKNTALTTVHEALGAKMMPFAGYNMPIQYEGVSIEHETVREKLGVFDVSHMGEFFLEGPNALELIQKVTSNDISKIADGQAQYSCLPNKDGGIVDDLIIYRIHAEKFLLVVNASNIEKDWNWISGLNDLDVQMTNASEEYSLLAVQGPKAVEAMQSLTDINLSEIKFYHFEIGSFAGLSDIIVSATGYTGSGGFEIYFKNEQAKEVWKAVMTAGESYGIKPIGLAARDTLRLEMGYCLYGNDIDDTTSPLEAGLGWITKFTKDFTNSEALKAQKEAGLNRRLVAFELVDKGVPRAGYDIVDQDGNPLGHVTSGTMGPSVKKGIGLGYVKKGYTKADSEIYIAVRKKRLKAKVVKLPFYKG